MKKIIVSLVLVLAAITGLSACADDTSTTATQAQQQNNDLAGQEYQMFSAAVPYPFANTMPTDPLERKNLSRRLVTQNTKGSTAYVYLFTYSGQVLGYYVINGKVSSTGSQMTSSQVNVHCGYGGTYSTCTNDAVGDDGSFGPNEGGQNGVFFFTAAGTLVETNQPWVSSTQPLPIYANVPKLG